MTAAPRQAPDAAPPLKVVVVNGSPRRASKTVGLVGVILDTLRTMVPARTAQIDVYRLGPGFTAATDREEVSPEIENMLRLAERADLLIAAAPVYRGSYPGMFKHFFDLVDQYALANKPVLLAATGGGDHHALMLEHALRPLFGFFQALTVPVSIYASAGDFDGVVLLNPRIHGRIEMALTDVIDILRARTMHPDPGAYPAIPPGDEVSDDTGDSAEPSEPGRVTLSG